MHVRTTRLLCATAPCVRVPDMTQTNASPKRVYIDFDDVLCETALGFTDIVRDAFGRDVAFDDIHSFDLWKAFDLTRDEYEHLMVLGHKDDFLGTLVAIPGARDVLHAWREAGVPQAGRAVRGLDWGHIGSRWRTWLGV
jgi:hypothetical protein